jgi:bifunctional ADP-heptose synthase (sugar kinase/adenylyltransferase)
MACASVVVAKLGTATLNPDELVFVSTVEKSLVSCRKMLYALLNARNIDFTSEILILGL